MSEDKNKTPEPSDLPKRVRLRGMQYSIIGVFKNAYSFLDAEKVINLYKHTCMTCGHEWEMFFSDHCRTCCFWGNPRKEERPTGYEESNIFKDLHDVINE